MQDAYLRWHAADRTAIEEPRRYLGTVVTRLCLDRMKSAQARREALRRPVAARAGRRRGLRRRGGGRSGARHFGRDAAAARTAFPAGAGELPLARCLRSRLHRDRARARSRRSRLPSARGARPSPYRGRPAALPGLARGRPSVCRRVSGRDRIRRYPGLCPNSGRRCRAVFGWRRQTRGGPQSDPRRGQILRFFAGVARKNPSLAVMRCVPPR